MDPAFPGRRSCTNCPSDQRAPTFAPACGTVRGALSTWIWLHRLVLRRPAVDQAWIGAWCMASLGSPPRAVLFETGYLSQVLGLVLDDERRVVVKVRPWADRLVGCAEVHA